MEGIILSNCAYKKDIQVGNFVMLNGETDTLNVVVNCANERDIQVTSATRSLHTVPRVAVSESYNDSHEFISSGDPYHTQRGASLTPLSVKKGQWVIMKQSKEFNLAVGEADLWTDDWIANFANRLCIVKKAHDDNTFTACIHTLDDVNWAFRLPASAVRLAYDTVP